VITRRRGFTNPTLAREAAEHCLHFAEFRALAATVRFNPGVTNDS
jgi:hypothetical protein